jgi:uncharacterized protein YeaO (DUF488 family)
MKFRIRRVYDPPSKEDGACFLVDRLWPRGVKKESLALEGWCKEAAPSPELRQWFQHDPEKWAGFQRRYRAELDGKPEAWEPLLQAVRRGPVTLLYSARDAEHNNAVALRAYLEERQSRCMR